MICHEKKICIHENDIIDSHKAFARSSQKLYSGVRSCMKERIDIAAEGTWWLRWNNEGPQI